MGWVQERKKQEGGEMFLSQLLLVSLLKENEIGRTIACRGVTRKLKNLFKKPQKKDIICKTYM
jgi:hypothetical protein